MQPTDIQIIENLINKTITKEIPWNSGYVDNQFYFDTPNSGRVYIQKDMNFSRMGWDIGLYFYDVDENLLKEIKYIDMSGRTDNKFTEGYDKAEYLLNVIKNNANTNFSNSSLDSIMDFINK